MNTSTNTIANATSKMSWADIVDMEDRAKSSLPPNPSLMVPVVPATAPRPTNIAPIPPAPVPFGKAYKVRYPMEIMKTIPEEKTQPNENEDVSKYISDTIALADSLPIFAIHQTPTGDQESKTPLGTLRLYHYLQCDEATDEATKQVRGIVRMKDTIICKTFPFILEVSAKETDLIQKKLSGLEWNQVSCYESLEGAMIRMFFVENVWYISTHRRLNAFHSRWGIHTQSFGDLFVDALQFQFPDIPSHVLLEWFCSKLSPTKNYTFLVCNDDSNRIVCDAPDHPTVACLGTFSRSTHALLPESENDSGVPYPPRHTFATIPEMLAFVCQSDWKQTPGLTLYLPNQTQLKISSPTYMDYFAVRGNEPSIKYRYLQVRNHAAQIQKLLTLYPEYKPVFQLCEDYLLYAARIISNTYHVRFVLKQTIRIPQEQYFVLQHCMDDMKTQKPDRLISDMTPISILRYINTQLTPTQLNRLIRSCLPPPPQQSQQPQESGPEAE